MNVKRVHVCDFTCVPVWIAGTVEESRILVLTGRTHAREASPQFYEARVQHTVLPLGAQGPVENSQERLSREVQSSSKIPRLSKTPSPWTSTHQGQPAGHLRGSHKGGTGQSARSDAWALAPLKVTSYLESVRGADTWTCVENQGPV